MLAVVGAISGQGGMIDATALGIGEIGGSLLLGLVLGLPIAYLSGRIRPGEPTLAEAFGMVHCVPEWQFGWICLLYLPP